jgi:DNA phosphorothioation-dependent restriction protein DptG
MENPLRKTYRITPEQFERLKTIANNSGTSLSAVVRDAIDAYHPDELLEAIDSELIEKVSKEIKSASIDTRDRLKRAENTLDEISKRRP